MSEQDSSESPERENDLWCIGKMDSAEDEEHNKFCLPCTYYYQCYEKSYGISVFEYKQKEGLEYSMKDKLEKFLNEHKNKPSLLVDSNIKLGSRKIVKIGDSHGITIPKSLDQIYPKGSSFLVLWHKTDSSLYFYGQGSFIDNEAKEVLRTAFEKNNAALRSVVYVALNLLVIPRQFVHFFNLERKVQPQFSKGSNVLFCKSNLSSNEFYMVTQKQLEQKQPITIRDYSSKQVEAGKYVYDNYVDIGDCECGKRNVKLYDGLIHYLCKECLEKEKAEETRQQRSTRKAFKQPEEQQQQNDLSDILPD